MNWKTRMRRAGLWVDARTIRVNADGSLRTEDLPHGNPYRDGRTPPAPCYQIVTWDHDEGCFGYARFTTFDEIAARKELARILGNGLWQGIPPRILTSYGCASDSFNTGAGL